MENYNINEIKNLHWKIETVNKKHRAAHLAAEIWYCAHIFLGIFVLLLKIEYFALNTGIIANPPIWLGVLCPLLTIGQYEATYISVLATAACFFLVPAVISTVIYLLFSIPLKKCSTIGKNPHRNAKANDILENTYRMKPAESGAAKILVNRKHAVVWIQVACFAALFLALVIYGTIQGKVLPDELAAAILCVALASPAYSLYLYLLRWIERLLFAPCYKLFDAIYSKRVKKPLNRIRESSLYNSYINHQTELFHAKLRREEENKRREEARKREIEAMVKKHVAESPVFLEDIMRHMRNNEASNTNDNDDPLGMRDGVPVDGTGI